MKIKRFEDIIAWQKGQDFAVDIYNLFETHKDYNFKNQICSAVVSISNNIAEGFDRSSDADFPRFLYIALSSNSETKSMLYLAGRLNIVKEEKKQILLAQSEEIARVIRGLIKSLPPKK